MAIGQELTGQTFGKLTVLGLGPNRGPKRRWRCQCECGRETLSQTSDLIAGKATGCRSCAVKRHGNTAFGGWQTPTYRSWDSMKQRCENPNAIGYHRYGGRGITVCIRWRECFENFLADMGERPEGTSIDRINGDGNYEPSNCRWATRSEQNAKGRRFNNPAAWAGRNRDPLTGRFSS